MPQLEDAAPAKQLLEYFESKKREEVELVSGRRGAHDHKTIRINGVRLTQYHRDRMQKWAKAPEGKLFHWAKVDEYLASVDLMVFEYELWCEDKGYKPWVKAPVKYAGRKPKAA